MGASSRTLEITVISGENVNVKEEAYVVVRAESLKCCTTKMVKDSATSGSVSKDGNNNNNGSSSFLSWNEKLLLDAPFHARSVTFEVQSRNSKGNARPVGVARIAISEILGGRGGDQHVLDDESSLQVLSYRLRDWDGRRNGVIHFAVRVAVAPEESVAKPGPMEPVKDSGDKKKSSGAVLGVPLWWKIYIYFC